MYMRKGNSMSSLLQMNSLNQQSMKTKVCTCRARQIAALDEDQREFNKWQTATGLAGPSLTPRGCGYAELMI
jgi:hypothetical protein